MRCLLRFLVWLLGCFVVLGSLAFPKIVCAEEVSGAQEQCAQDLDGPRRAVMDFEGYPGVWIAAPVMRCMTNALAELPLLRERVRLYQERSSLRDEQVAQLRHALDLSTNIEDEFQSALGRALAAQQRAEARIDVWWRSPAFWFVVGVVSAGVLVALTAYGLSAVD